MDEGELLETSHPPEAKHRPLSSSKRQVRVLGSIVEPAAGDLPICCADFPQGSTVRPKSISDDHLRATMLSHRFLEEFQCSISVSRLRDIASQGAFGRPAQPQVKFSDRAFDRSWKLFGAQFRLK